MFARFTARAAARMGGPRIWRELRRRGMAVLGRGSRSFQSSNRRLVHERSRLAPARRSAFTRRVALFHDPPKHRGPPAGAVSTGTERVAATHARFPGSRSRVARSRPFDTLPRVFRRLNYRKFHFTIVETRRSMLNNYGKSERVDGRDGTGTGDTGKDQRASKRISDSARKRSAACSAVRSRCASPNIS